MVKADVREMSRLTEALSEMHRSALPNVVRNTLNDLAFDTKKGIPASAKENFINRSKNFFKANSGVGKATGYDLKAMAAEAGMVSKDRATKNLEQQEKGGQIPKRAFIPLDGARTSKSHTKKIAKRNQLSSLRILNTKAGKGSRGRGLFRTAAIAKRVGAAVLHKGVVYKVKGSGRVTGKGRNRKVSLLPLYSYSKGRSASVKPTNFIEEAARKVTPNIGVYYKKNFERQVAKLKRKNRL